MNNLLDRLIGQLDALIPFLAIAHRDVFDLIQREKDIWFPEDQQSAVPNSYSVYRMQVTHAAFLLGYSYFEAFLTDLVQSVYQLYPKMLPAKKELKFSEILGVEDYEAVLGLMVDREVLALLYQGMGEIIEYFARKLQLEWPKEHEEETIVVSLMRNCLIHNNGLADGRLSRVSDFNVGDKIELGVDDVHSYGIVVRSVARYLYREAQRGYLDREQLQVSSPHVCN